MKELIDKYRQDELTPLELSELQEKARTSSDAEIDAYLFDVWLNDDNIETSAVSDKRMAKMKRNIHTVIGKKPSVLSKFVRWSQIAAAILLPVFIAFSVYLYREKSIFMSVEEMMVTTGKTERASVTLPDGSAVSLNTESRLAYHPRNYNKRERTINFSGEGYFQVLRNESTPFLINAKGLRVQVLGTIFNLSVRETNNSAVLSLEEGSVMLISTLNNSSVILQANQKAILEYLTGEITVVTDDFIHDLSAWRCGTMVFRNTELSQVINSIERIYGITIDTSAINDLSDKFTGTLPIDNLYEALEVIELLYHLRATIAERRVVIRAR
ncbi:MAG: FecR domain-containing protein [Dysgonamonadaceae bacterium]|jgi:ferric-dicitrate binding protein FerR (iron transport regulator)|nr:FecR domain-containing protein [Dysgonamonadaceae bacterium]